MAQRFLERAIVDRAASDGLAIEGARRERVGMRHALQIGERRLEALSVEA